MTAIAVDWDGTLVEDVYPAQGTWLPGALNSLYRLVRDGYTVYVHTCRIAPAPVGDPFGWRDPHEVHHELAYIRRMLDAEGLESVRIWDLPFKPPAFAYIDNRAIAFKGDWEEVIRELDARASAELVP